MLSPDFEKTLREIENYAKKQGHAMLLTEHLLYGLLHNDSATEILTELDVDVKLLEKRLVLYLMNFAPQHNGEVLGFGASRGFERAISNAIHAVQASGRQNSLVEGADVLAALLGEKDSHAAALLKEQGVSRLRILKYMAHVDSERTVRQAESGGEIDKRDRQDESKRARAKNPLELYAQNLNKRAQQGLSDPLVGRSEEVERCAQVLARRRKNNPLLVGDPGVGKTAIAEGLAWLIINQKVAPVLKDAVIYSLDVGALIAGTKFRGDFESRMKDLLDALKKEPHAILFIDEIHMVVGAGSSMNGNTDMSNLIKPALANGELRCIGSTTFVEYRQIFEKDSALSRRFQKVDVKEPSIEDTLAILRGLSPSYELHHGVRYTDEALRLAVELSVKHIHDKFLPDKAIDVIDEAGAMTNIARQYAKQNEELKLTDFGLDGDVAKLECDDSFELLEVDDAEQGVDLHDIKTGDEAFSELFIDVETGVQADDQSINPTQLSQAIQSDQAEDVTWIEASHIETVIAKIARIPPKSVSQDDKATLKHLERDLRQVVFGQDAAITSLSDAIKLSRAGLKATDKPIGAFMFAGPTGVGKTEIARQLAFTLGVDLIRFDMSEYMEAHTASRLIGAPPGYVGYDQGGLLTEKIHQHPYCVLLLDEIEKAHADVFNLLLQVMDHATLTDNNGRAVSFKQVVLIMTTNIGAERISRSSMGFTEQDHSTDSGEALKQVFTPEFRNRLDAIIHFEPLDAQAIGSVVDKFLTELQVMLDDKEVVMSVSDAAKAYLATQGYDRLMGARPMARLIQDKVKKPLAELLLFGELADGGHVQVDLADDALIFEVIHSHDDASNGKEVETLN